MPTLLIKTLNAFSTKHDRGLRASNNMKESQHNKYQLEINDKGELILPNTTTLKDIDNNTNHNDQQEKKEEIVPPPPPPENISIWETVKMNDIQLLKSHIYHATTKQARHKLLNDRDPSTETTLLHLAITQKKFNTRDHSSFNRKLEIISLLLQHGAQPDECNVFKVQPIHMIPLHFPFPEMTIPLIHVLMQHGANINARDGDGWTPLHYAARFCQPPDATMKVLISDYGANINSMDDNQQKTCLYPLIASGDHIDCFKWLMENTRINFQLLGNTQFLPTMSPSSSSSLSSSTSLFSSSSLSSPLSSSTSPSSSTSAVSLATGAAKIDHFNNHSNNLFTKIIYGQSPEKREPIMKKASLILQAVKYGRLQILQYLIHHPTSYEALKEVITMDELEQAQFIVQLKKMSLVSSILSMSTSSESESASTSSDTNDNESSIDSMKSVQIKQQKEKWETIEKEIQYLSTSLKDDPHSYISKKLQYITARQYQSNTMLQKVGRFLMKHKRY